MLRIDQTIRLTAAERSEFSDLVGFASNPQTVTQHDQALLQLKAEFDQVVAETQPELDAQGGDESGVAEALLMSAVLQGMLLDV